MAPQPSKLKLSILMPVRNEAGNIPIMLKLLHVMVDTPHEILIVYDSPDDTSIAPTKLMQKIFSNVKLVHNTLGRGVANAIRAGVLAAKGDYVLLFAVDEIGPVTAIPDMVALMDEGCDLVSCSRYAHGGRRLGGSFIESVLSRLGNKVFRFLSGSVLTDCTTGIKMFRRSIFSRITLEAKPVGWAVVFELGIKAQLAGFRLGEVPIVSIDRVYGGQSTFKLGPWFKEYLHWFWWGAKRLHTAKKTQVTVRIPSTIS
jgi:dolichol-phosphate mannosyltransferase